MVKCKPDQPVARAPRGAPRHFYFSRGGILNEQISFNPFPVKAEIKLRRNSENT